MEPRHSFLLFAAGVLSGGLNALAGGGGFITFPTLLHAGVPPILANTTGTVAVWPGTLGSLYAYRRRLEPGKHPLARYLALAVAGSVLGAFLLLFTTNAFFMALLPWLLLFATLLFILGKDITSRIARWRGHGRPLSSVPAHMLIFLIAIYGGYFGGGMGIMTLAVLTLLGLDDIHEMNALKSLLVAVMCGAGVATFVLGGKVAWPECLVMTGGCVIGGYGAGRLVLKIDPALVRRGVSVIAVGMTLYFFFRAYWPR